MNRKSFQIVHSKSLHKKSLLKPQYSNFFNKVLNEARTTFKTTNKGLGVKSHHKKPLHFKSLF